MRQQPIFLPHEQAMNGEGKSRFFLLGLESGSENLNEGCSGFSRGSEALSLTLEKKTNQPEAGLRLLYFQLFGPTISTPSWPHKRSVFGPGYIGNTSHVNGADIC